MELSKTDKIKIFVRASEIIALPEHWTTEEFVRDAEGYSLDSPQDAEAVAFCVRGAISKALLEAGYEEGVPDSSLEYALSEEARRILNVPQYYDLGGWNNGNDHATVLAGLSKVVQTLQAA